MPKIHRSLFLLVTLPLAACGAPTTPDAQSSKSGTPTTTNAQSSTSGTPTTTNAQSSTSGTPTTTDAQSSKSGATTTPSTQTSTSSLTGDSGTSTKPKAALAWTPCKIGETPGFECTKLQVPLNHAEPSGKTITLALTRKKHTDPDYRGVILSNPGGPGLPGQSLATVAETLPKGIGKKYDWVAIDPRGTGGSLPKLDCIGDTKATHGLPYVPKDQAQIDTWRAEAKKIAQRCAQGPAKELLPHLRTTDSVNDLEAVRKALGVEKVTYWGSSYGSYLGMMYATLYPERIEKMALDGVASPLKSWYESNLTQPKTLGESLQKFYNWLAANHAQFQLGNDTATVRKRIDDRLAQLRQSPPLTDGKRNMEQAMSEALQQASYGVTMWTPVGMALKMYLVDKDPSILRAVGEGTGTDVRSVYLAVTCSEVAWPDWATTIKDAEASHELAPNFSWLNTWFNGPCVDWPVPAVLQPEIRADKVNFPILLLSETFDGATPFSGALDARRLFPTSALVEGLNGTTHSATLAGGECVQQVLFDFFSAGKLPPRGTQEAADKQCDPVKPSSPGEGG